MPTEQEFGSDGQFHPAAQGDPFGVAAASIGADDTFECTLRSDTRLPNDFHEWPEPYRRSSDAAIVQLLLRHPGAIVVSDTSECVDETHHRFPDGDEHKGKFWLIRTVKLDIPKDQFEASEPGAAAQRHPMENLVLTTARAVEHLTRNGDGKEHNEKLKAAIEDASKFGG